MVFVNVCPQEYGDIEYCVILKNKTTGESKGLGYVRYYKPSQAALAIENCDKSKDVPDPFPFTFLQEVDKPWCLMCFCVEIVIYNCQMLALIAYRAILAEPRNKAAASEDYSGGSSRNDYMAGAEPMNQYALPLRKTKKKKTKKQSKTFI